MGWSWRVLNAPAVSTQPLGGPVFEWPKMCVCVCVCVFSQLSAFADPCDEYESFIILLPSPVGRV